MSFKHIISQFSNDISSGEFFKVINRETLKVLSVYYQDVTLLHKHPIIHGYIDDAKSGFCFYLPLDNNFRIIPWIKLLKKLLIIFKTSDGTQSIKRL